jgi:hypothetical protein
MRGPTFNWADIRLQTTIPASQSMFCSAADVQNFYIKQQMLKYAAQAHGIRF